MSALLNNPFGVTSANELPDQEIHRLWVDFAGGFSRLARPDSPKPMFIMGGKGSGKTHLMRYLSHTVQRIRHQDNVVEGVRAERFFGVFMRFGDLNAVKFTGKGQREDTWNDVFAYYLELWLGQLFLKAVQDMFRACPAEAWKAFDGRVAELLGVHSGRASEGGFVGHLGTLLHQADEEVRDAAITRSIARLKVQLPRGRLIFGLPRAFRESFTSVPDVQVVYLLDEFENLTLEQQKYINTLVRLREGPCTFRIGARLYGIKTRQTLTGDEENRRGAEYDELRLDELRRRVARQYRDFAVSLCVKRLAAAGYAAFIDATRQESAKRLASAFESVSAHDVIAEAVRESDARGAQRETLKHLAQRIEEGRRSNTARGVVSDEDAHSILADVADPDPVLERVKAFILYGRWRLGVDLKVAATRIRAEAERFKLGASAPRIQSVWSHFRGDLEAQLLRDYSRKQMYVGLNSFVQMSDGLPRNLLLILQNVLEWSTFNEEKPFESGAISIDAQQRGVRDASEYFLRDARVGSPSSDSIRESVRRVAGLMRAIRYSDKPAECSLCAFSASKDGVSASAMRLIELAEQWSLLVPVRGGQRDRNTRLILDKYQLNRMLAPYWDLPIGRRGAVALSSEELEAIFTHEPPDAYERIKSIRLSRMMAPGFGKRQKPARQGTDTQGTLPGL